MPLLNMSHISKSFAGVSVLQDVSLTVESGVVHALLGENGAGKSTLMNILTGSVAADAGSVEFAGKELTGASIKQTEAAGIAFVHQELNLFNDLCVYDNIFLGHELTTKFGSLNKKEMIKHSRELFERLGVDIDPLALVADLSASQRQLLEISKSLFFEAKLLVLDEPTTALNNDEVEHLFSIVNKLKAEGIAFIFISHKMPEILALCDSYTVLRNGHFIAEGKIADTTGARLAELMVGSELSGKELWEPRDLGEQTLKIEHLSSAAFSDFNLDLKKGEVIGITGLQGCGASELLQALFGAYPVSAGVVEVKGKKLRLNSIKASMRAGLALLPSNRKDNSVIGDASILENFSVSEQVLSATKPVVHKAKELSRYQKLKETLNIKAPDPEAEILSLSGGNQQKVFLARWLNTEADILLLDNPTQGIDVGAKAEIYRLILELARAGKTILIHTLEIPELREVADSCLVLYEGSIAVRLEHEDINERTVMLYSTNSHTNTNAQSA